ncbi:MAG: sigma-70 family RNA polymerase sigma factor [Armatimonadetes bacterium]|nr:sigma-70 family RNA polymerase sigma factor [Armatimonadota bacterium]
MTNTNNEVETTPVPTGVSGANVLAGLTALRSRVVPNTVSAPATATPRQTNAELLAATRHGKTNSEKNRAAEELRRRIKTLCAAALDRYTSQLTAQEADDLTQEVMVRLLCTTDEAAEITGAYISRVAVNLLIDKRRALDRRGLNKPGVSVDDCEAAVAIPDPAPTPEQSLTQNFESFRLRQVISDALSPTEAKVVWLRVAEDRSHAEIADELGIKEANARKHYERGLKRLRSHVGETAFAAL